MEEIWKEINGFEGYYEVSNLGRVRSLDRIVYRKHKNKEGMVRTKGKTMALHLRRDGYPIVDLYKEHKRRNYAVHRLVASAFVSNPGNRPEVDHINTVRTDNRASNLRWVNRSENNKNPITNKRMSEANKGKRCKPVIQYDKSGTLIAKYSSILEASKATGFHKTTISNNAKGIHINQKYNWKYGTI